jgi:hypothetical protein
MMKRALSALQAAVFLALLTTWADPANAGRSCEAAQPPKLSSVQNSLTLAALTHTALESEFAKSGAQVVLLARAGQDLSKYRLRYSHLGWAYRVPLAASNVKASNEPGDARSVPPPAAQWLVVHKLNSCGTDVADIYRQGLGEFFLDDPLRFEAAWVVPTADIQAKMMPLLQSSNDATRMHVRPYSMVSYVWSERYQQSNQWAIETLGSAMTGSRERRAIYAWLQQSGYLPTELNIPALTRLGGRLTRANVAFDDHPSELRFSDRIRTVTADSVFQWMVATRLSGPVARTAL